MTSKALVVRSMANTDRVANLFHDDRFADIVLICDERRFKAHRAVLCSASSVIDDLVTAAPLESGSRIVRITTCDPFTLSRVLEYTYTKRYTTDDEAINLPERRPAPSKSQVFGPGMQTMLELAQSNPLEAQPGTPLATPLRPRPLHASNGQHEYSLLDDVRNLIEVDQSGIPHSVKSISAAEEHLSDPSKSHVIAALWNHVKVFVAAAHFDIAELRETALVKIGEGLTDAAKAPGFTTFVAAVFQVYAEENDADPCKLVADECSWKIVSLMADTHFTSLVKGNSNLAFLILSNLVEVVQLAPHLLEAGNSSNSDAANHESPEPTINDSSLPTDPSASQSHPSVVSIDSSPHSISTDESAVERNLPHAAASIPKAGPGASPSSAPSLATSLASARATNKDPKGSTSDEDKFLNPEAEAFTPLQKAAMPHKGRGSFRQDLTFVEEMKAQIVEGDSKVAALKLANAALSTAYDNLMLRFQRQGTVLWGFQLKERNAQESQGGRTEPLLLAQIREQAEREAFIHVEERMEKLQADNDMMEAEVADLLDRIKQLEADNAALERKIAVVKGKQVS